MKRYTLNRQVILDAITTLSVKANRFPEEVDSAFSKIEKQYGKNSSHTFFGAINFNNAEVEYRACLEQKNKHAHNIQGIEKYIIPGGRYVSSRLLNWTRNTHLIKEIFNDLENKYIFDQTRPQLEYYKSNRELVLMLPIIEKEKQLQLNFDNVC